MDQVIASIIVLALLAVICPFAAYQAGKVKGRQEVIDRWKQSLQSQKALKGEKTDML